MSLVNGVPDSFHQLFAAWVRLEPRARSQDLSDGVAARVADPLWMLARQWQVGELKAENAGSPIRVLLEHESQPVDRVRVGGIDHAIGPDAIPLETLVEREPVPLDWRLRVRIGQAFERLARAAHGRVGVALITLYRAAHGVTRPPDAQWVKTDHATRRFIDFFAGRAIDGKKLLDARAAGTLGAPPRGMTFRHVDLLFRRLSAWRASLHSVPSAPAAAWQSSRLAYRFEANVPPPAPAEADRTHLVAEEHRNGELDWHSVSAVSGLAGEWTPGDPIDAPPTRISAGGASPRWWAFEDAHTDFGSLDAATTDLSKLLLMEFVLIFGDDWFSVPVPSALSRLVRLTGASVQNVFGEVLPVPSARRPAGTPMQRWEVFTLSAADGAAAAGVGDCLFIPPVAASREQSAPLEEVRFLRDEGANMVWGVEHILPNGLGAPVRGFEAQLERRQRLAAASGGTPPAAPAASPAGLTYRLATPVPENWIPFVPARTPTAGGRHTVVLQRAQMLRNAAAESPEPIPALSRLLGTWRDPLLQLDEHTVPRAGLRVLLTAQRARDAAGRTYVWLGKKVLTGRGEGASGLRFDVVE